MLAILEDLLRLDRDWTGSDGAIVEAYQALGPAGHGALSGGLYNEFRLVPPRERKALAVGSPASVRKVHSSRSRSSISKYCGLRACAPPNAESGARRVLLSAIGSTDGSGGASFAA